ncbi:hypothetical protein [Nitrosarchaeum koreense]|uniref:Uncharacterized protein n=1 Tax=Nitrosarchaeum koreense MY1 TaxID=1001994 RepID=F9CXW2_9ARCH|nr:hypothetical protein [Nitrosarchaeum koreense]EGP94078.1 hypothetical protein MY1_1321 [Nitrosarchaeum koreense MY1]
MEDKEKIEQLLKEEKETLLAEVEEAVKRKKVLMKKDEDEISYRKRRY